jgi:hypothetical protein
MGRHGCSRDAVTFDHALAGWVTARVELVPEPGRRPVTRTFRVKL